MSVSPKIFCIPALPVIPVLLSCKASLSNLGGVKPPGESWNFVTVSDQITPRPLYLVTQGIGVWGLICQDTGYTKVSRIFQMV